MKGRLIALILVGALVLPASVADARRGGGGIRGPSVPKGPSLPKTPKPYTPKSSKSPSYKGTGVPRAPRVYSPKPRGTFSTVPRSKQTWSSGSRAKAVDGDTFYASGHRYRVRGIDTPERGEPRAAAAKARLEQLLNSGQVTVAPRAVDKYGRTVADVYVDGRNVADTMRAEGLAK